MTSYITSYIHHRKFPTIKRNKIIKRKTNAKQTFKKLKVELWRTYIHHRKFPTIKRNRKFPTIKRNKIIKRKTNFQKVELWRTLEDIHILKEQNDVRNT